MSKTDTKKITGNTVTGKVLSMPTHKTVKVAVETYHRHPVYRKAVRRTRKFLAHYEENTGIAVGDTITMQEIPPVSKKKYYRVLGKV